MLLSKETYIEMCNECLDNMANVLLNENMPMSEVAILMSDIYKSVKKYWSEQECIK